MVALRDLMSKPRKDVVRPLFPHQSVHPLPPCPFRDSPVEEASIDHGRPRQPGVFLALEIFLNVLFPLEYGDFLHDLVVGSVVSELAGNDALDACLDGDIDDSLVE